MDVSVWGHVYVMLVPSEARAVDPVVLELQAILSHLIWMLLN